MSKGNRNRERRKEEKKQLEAYAKRNNLQKMVDAECRKKLLELDEEFSADWEAAILWDIHEITGYGKIRLERLYRRMYQSHKELREHYEISENDEGWLYREKLKEIGVDIEALRKEC